jgi:hypothetical protein
MSQALSNVQAIPGKATFQNTLPEKVVNSILAYCRGAQNTVFQQQAGRAFMVEMDRQYMREKDWTQANLRARNANTAGDASKMRDVTVPIVMPQVEQAVEYMTNVFLTGYPIFGVASDAQGTEAAQQMETIIGENSKTARWARELIMMFRDGLKYNICGVELEWAQKTTYQIVNDPSAANGAKQNQTLWKGNKIRRLDLYNTFWDMRVAPAEVHEKGDYVGYNELLTRVQFKQRCNDLFGTVSPAVVEKALASQMTESGGITGSQNSFGYYIPVINPWPFRDQNANYGIDWMAWVTDDVYTNSEHPDYKNHYLWTVLYARILPSDFGIQAPAKNTPQVWKFIIINGQVILYAERQSNAHNYIPCFLGQPIEDGLRYQTKSYAANVTDMQDLSSALWKAFVDSKRRLVTDRVLYDPSAILAKDINSPNPSAKIPVRPTAYGQPLERAVYQFPYHDEQAGSLVQAATAVAGMADMANSQNKAQQGQFVKGNRTKVEYQDIIGHSNDRNQVMAICFEEQIFTPLKEAIKLNILQFQDPVVISSPENGQQIPISPETLRQEAVTFEISDGLLPSDKIISGDEFMAALQVLGSSPQIGGEFNMGDMIAYLFEQRGANIAQFKKSPQQMQYEQQMGAWQQAAALAAQKGTAFSTPMPQPPQLDAKGQSIQQGGQPQQDPGSANRRALQQTQGS